MFRKKLKIYKIFSFLLILSLFVLLGNEASAAIVPGSFNVNQVNPNMVFSWDPVDLVTCGGWLQIDDNSDFSSLIYSSGEIGWGYVSPVITHNVPIALLPLSTTLYWRFVEDPTPCACHTLSLCTVGIASNGPNFVVVPLFQDIGLNMQTSSGIVSIAVEIGVPTSPLRIAKGGIVYGIALVNPGDPDDSGVRIQTASGLRALRRL